MNSVHYGISILNQISAEIEFSNSSREAAVRVFCADYAVSEYLQGLQSYLRFAGTFA